MDRKDCIGCIDVINCMYYKKYGRLGRCLYRECRCYGYNGRANVCVLCEFSPKNKGLKFPYIKPLPLSPLAGTFGFK